MKTLNFANRNFKEIIRDPLSLIFSILLPLFLLFIFQQFEIPSNVYKIENFTPGILIFSFSFLTLFTATLISKDRATSLLTRLCASPMKAGNYIIGYILSILPLVLVQNLLFFIVAIILGLKFTFNIILSVFVSVPISVLFIALGLIVGCITSDKASAGVSSIVVQLVAFTSGIYFEPEMLKGFFKTICEILPFSHCLNIIKSVLNNNYDNISNPIIIILIYIMAALIIAAALFNNKLKGDSK